MALGATVEIKKAGGNGAHLFFIEITVVGDTSYPTGGSLGLEALVEAQTGLVGIEILGVVDQGLNGGYIPRWNRAASGLMMIENDAAGVLPEVTNTTALNGTTFSLLLICQ